MDRRRALVLLGLTVTPGCLRLRSPPGTDEPGTPRPDPSGTPGTDEPTDADPTTDTDPGTAAAYPLGLEPDGVSPVLADAHQRALSQTTFHLERINEDLVNGAVREHTYEVDAEAPAAVFTLSGPAEVSKYITDAGTLWAQPVGSGTTYGQNAVPFSWVSLHDPVEVAAETGTFEPPERIQDDPPVWRATTDGIDDPSRLLTEHGGDRVEGFSATLEVTATSVVRSLDMEFELVDGEELRAAGVELTVSDVGERDVSEPEWVATARDNAAQLTATVADDRRTIWVGHTGGNPVPTGTTVAINEMTGADGSEIDDVQTSAPFEAGQRIAVYAENGATRIARESMPADADPREIPDNDEVWFGMSFRYAQFYHSGAAGVLPRRPERQS